MNAQRKVLLVGGTGRTGRHVLEQLLDRGIGVRAIVRSPGKLPAGATDDARLEVVAAELLSLSGEELRRHADGCNAVISCLGHNTDARGIFGPPRDLVTRATSRLCRAVEELRPERPVKLILMSSVSVNHPGRVGAPRGPLDRAALWMIRRVVPPAKDNQRAADFLHGDIGTAHPYLRWAVVRPDTLRDGDISPYSVHEGHVSRLFAPRDTNMANVAHFMCELAVEPAKWEEWTGKMPVIVNEAA